MNSSAQALKNLLQTLLPPDHTYHPVVKPETQLKNLEQLDGAIVHESFYLVFNLLTGEFDHKKGLEKWLGYSNKEFTLESYLNIIHPGQAILHNMIAQSMYKTLCNGIFRLHFSKQRYISQIALKHYSGEYIVFKKTTSIFQYDDKNRLLAQLNEFTKLDAYESEPLKPRITEMDGLQKEDFEKIVFQMTLKNFMEKKYFSEKEFMILKRYAENESVSTKQLAAFLKVATTTVDTFNKRILEKARNTFTHQFNNAREVAVYLKKEKIF